MLSSYCQKHYSLELSFLWKQSKCKCIIFSVYVTKIPSGDHQCNLLGFLERTDTIPNLSLFNVKDYVRIFNISEISLPTPKTWSVSYKCERFQFRSRSHFGIFPGHWSSRSKQKNTISMEFLQHFREIQMDTLPVKMAVEFKNIAHFWKYAADEKHIFLKTKTLPKVMRLSGSRILTLCPALKSTKYFFLREQLDHHDQIMKAHTTKLSTNLYNKLSDLIPITDFQIVISIFYGNNSFASTLEAGWLWKDEI